MLLSQLALFVARELILVKFFLLKTKSSLGEIIGLCLKVIFYFFCYFDGLENFEIIKIITSGRRVLKVSFDLLSMMSS